MPGGEARFRDFLAKQSDVILFPRSIAVKAREELVRIGFAEKVWEKHSGSIARK
jgi:hypothetical protein